MPCSSGVILRRPQSPVILRRFLPKDLEKLADSFRAARQLSEGHGLRFAQNDQPKGSSEREKTGAMYFLYKKIIA